MICGQMMLAVGGLFEGWLINNIFSSRMGAYPVGGN